VSTTVSTPASRRSAKTVTIKAALMLSAVLTLVFLISYMFSEQGISELQRSRARVQSLQSEIDRLEAENERLAGEIESLKRSTFAVERIAREDLSMSKPGEVVYVLPPPAQGQGTTRGDEGQGGHRQKR
jgi:cell division protein FtsB